MGTLTREQVELIRATGQFESDAEMDLLCDMALRSLETQPEAAGEWVETLKEARGHLPKTVPWSLLRDIDGLLAKSAAPKQDQAREESKRQQVQREISERIDLEDRTAGRDNAAQRGT